MNWPPARCASTDQIVERLRTLQTAIDRELADGKTLVISSKEENVVHHISCASIRHLLNVHDTYDRMTGGREHYQRPYIDGTNTPSMPRVVTRTKSKP